MGRKFGYARVSTKEQNLDRQIEALLPYVGDKENIFPDKASGKDIEGRDKMKALMVLLDKGDSLYVTSLDRLGRNKKDIKNILTHFKSKGVMVHILDLPTTMTNSDNEMMNATMDMITNLLIEVMGYMAEMERKHIRQRQAEGIVLAKRKGIHFGRVAKPYPETWENDYLQWKAKKCTAVSLIKKYGFAPATFYAKVHEYEKRLADDA